MANDAEWHGMNDEPRAHDSTRSRDVRLQRGVAVMVGAAAVVYLIWRVFYSVPGATWWFAWPFWFLEVSVAIRYAMTVAELWDLGAAPLDRDATREQLASARVAVLLPTYDEPWEILLPTIAGAMAIEGADEVWLLDDGARDDVAALAAELGCGYVARGDRAHAKAGNLNHALGVIDADFYAVFDADHVADPAFLVRTMPHFADPQVALVQTPQEFHNVGSFVHGSDDHHEERFFHRAIQPGKNRFGAAFWCGSGAVVRAKALRSIGGVSTASITEDLHTTIRLHQAGWRTVHHDEVLAAGLAPRTFDEFRVQRWRWGAGAMQTFAFDFPTSTHNLSRGQRFAYLASFLSWFDSWRVLAYMLAPALVLFTGARPVDSGTAVAFPLAVIVAFAEVLVVRWMGRGHLKLWLMAMGEVLRLPSNLSATLIFAAPRALRFKVTSKSATDGPGQQRGPILLWVLMTIVSAAVVWGSLSLLGLVSAGPELRSTAWIAVAWCLLNGAILLAALLRITDPRFAGEERHAVRQHGQLGGTLAGRPSLVEDVSPGGARVRVAGDWAATSGARATLEVAAMGTIPLEVEVTNVRVDGPTSVVGVAFADERRAPRVHLLQRIRAHEPA